MKHGVVVTVLVAGLATTGSAQVGYDPMKSPFRDLRETQELTMFSGYYRAKKDPARIVPQSGPMAGVHYQWRMSGPANLTGSIARVSSERNVIDPELPTCSSATTACKFVGTFRWPLYLFDLGMAMSLTGSRSFYNFVPDLKAGVGLASDFHSKPDVGDFAFGTRFALTWGAGVRWVPGNGGRYQVRADLTNHLYSVRYPDTYYRPVDDASTVFTTRQSKTAWLNNPGFTIGLSYLFSR